MGAKKKRQTFAKLKREQAVKERRERKQERKRAARPMEAVEESRHEGIVSEIAGRQVNR